MARRVLVFLSGTLFGLMLASVAVVWNRVLQLNPVSGCDLEAIATSQTAATAQSGFLAGKEHVAAGSDASKVRAGGPPVAEKRASAESDVPTARNHQLAMEGVPAESGVSRASASGDQLASSIRVTSSVGPAGGAVVATTGAGGSQVGATTASDLSTTRAGGEGAVVSRIIWLLWFTGFLNAPYLVQMVLRSWKLHNPTWTIVELTDDSIHKYMDVSTLKSTMSLQAKSDMIRLTLLARYGGVWADSTMLCFEPLDNWLSKVTQPLGFWTYGPICSWFVVASNQSYLIQFWKQAADDYWKDRTTPSGKIGGVSDYRWMDGVLLDGVRRHQRVRSEYERIAKVSCSETCGPHMFHHGPCRLEVNMPLNRQIKDCLDFNRPHAVKMTFHPRCDNPALRPGGATDSNGHYAIFKSLGYTVLPEAFPGERAERPPCQRGYLTTGFGDAFINRARMMCTALKHSSDTAPFAIVTSEGEAKRLNEEPDGCFDVVVPFRADTKIDLLHERYNVAPMLSLFDLLPFEETIFMDSDVLRVTECPSLWPFLRQEAASRGQSVVLMGKPRDCTWHWGTACKLEEKHKMRFPHTHAGLIYIKRDARAKAFFELARKVTRDYDKMMFLRKFKGGSKALEIHFSYAFGKLGWLPVDFEHQKVFAFNWRPGQDIAGARCHFHMFSSNDHAALYKVVASGFKGPLPAADCRVK